MTDKEKTEKLNDLMNKISFALKDVTLAQGFEIICKRISELEKENAELKEQIEKMENCWNCKFFLEKKYQVCIDYKKNNTRCCAFYKWELAE